MSAYSKKKKATSKGTIHIHLGYYRHCGVSRWQCVASPFLWKRLLLHESNNIHDITSTGWSTDIRSVRLRMILRCNNQPSPFAIRDRPLFIFSSFIPLPPPLAHPLQIILLKGGNFITPDTVLTYRACTNNIRAERTPHLMPTESLYTEMDSNRGSYQRWRGKQNVKKEIYTRMKSAYWSEPHKPFGASIPHHHRGAMKLSEGSRRSGESIEGGERDLTLLPPLL